MKVALIVPGGVDRTGTERVIPVLLWHIARLARVVDLHVFALRQEPRPSEYDLLGARVHNIGARPRRLRTVAALLTEHRRAHFDVVHAFWSIPQGVVAGLFNVLTDVPVVLSAVGGDLANLPEIEFGGRRTARGRAFVRFAASRASRVIVPSDFVRELAATADIDAEVLTLGIAFDEWPARDPVRRTSGTARLLHLADLNRVKDQSTLLRALRIVRDNGVAFHLDVVGVDTLNGRIQRLAAELGLTDCITFHGFVRRADLRPLAERNDVLVLSSRFEGDPIALLEAAAIGVPTVGTAVGHIRDWHPHAARAVQPGDAVSLAREVIRLLADEDERLRVAGEAKKRVLSIDADESTRQLLELYRDVMR